MRFTVGQKVLFITVIYTTSGEVPFFSTYRPWQDELNLIRTLLLECVEEHDVPGSFDDVIQYKGYVFKDEDGTRWLNQYPRAHYGQLDDSADRQVMRESDVFRDNMRTLESYLENVLRGIHSFSTPPNVDPSKANALRTHYRDVVELIAKRHHYVVTDIPYVAKLIDGTEQDIPGMRRIVIEPAAIVKPSKEVIAQDEKPAGWNINTNDRPQTVFGTATLAAHFDDPDRPGLTGGYHLSKFEPRPYQKAAIEAMEKMSDTTSDKNPIDPDKP